jgi:hypothetical protein
MFESDVPTEFERVNAAIDREEKERLPEEKVKALMELIKKIVDQAPAGCVGEHAVAMRKFLQQFHEVGCQISKAQTSEELNHALAGLRG